MVVLCIIVLLIIYIFDSVDLKVPACWKEKDWKRTFALERPLQQPTRQVKVEERTYHTPFCCQRWYHTDL